MANLSNPPVGGAGTAIDLSVNLLQDHQIEVLSFLLFQKGHQLDIKQIYQKTQPLTVNEMAVAIIQAYAATLELYLTGNPLKQTRDILRTRDLSVGIAITGSCVTSAILKEDFRSADLDIKLEFSKIPVPNTIDLSTEARKSFFLSEEGGVFLKKFHQMVAFEAAKRLLRLNNQKTLIQNEALKLAGLAPLPLKTEIEIESLKGSLFKNLLLFSGHAAYLLTFDDIDFFFKIPGMSCSTSLHLADSVMLRVPLDENICHLIPDRAFFDSIHGTKLCIHLMQDKVIHITHPDRIEFNGFERIIYAVTQGWSIPETGALFVLLKELFARTVPEKQKTPLPFERFFSLMNKKKTASGLGEVFCLRMFLNAYIVSLDYAQKGEPEAIFIADLFQEAFLYPEFKALFPSYVPDNFSHFGDLDLLLALEKLKLQLDSKICKKVKFVRHLEKQASAIGDFSKQEGVLIDRFMSISDCITTIQMLKSHFSKEDLISFLDPFIKPLSTIDMSFEEKIICILFMNQIECKDPYSYVVEDLSFYQKTVFELMVAHPSLLNIEPFKEGFLKVIEGIEISNKKLIKDLLVIEKDVVLAALFFKLRSSDSEEKSLEIIKGALKKEGLSFEKLSTFLITLKQELATSSQVLKWIELAFKSAEKNLPIEVFLHPNFGKILDKIPVEFKWDLPLWKNSFWQIFAHSFDEKIYPFYYKISTLHPPLFELTCPMAPLSIKKALLSHLIKDGQQDLIVFFLSEPGAFDYLRPLFEEQRAIFKNKGLKNALIALSPSCFSRNIEELFSKTGLAGQEMILAMMEQSEFSTQFAAITDVLAQAGVMYRLHDRLYFFVIKYLNEGALSEKRAKLVLALIRFLNMDDKTHKSVFKQAIDKWGPLWLELERKGDDDSIKEALYKIKEASIKFLALGSNFVKPWQFECEAFKWEHNTLEECVADYLKKPSEALIVAMHQRVQKKTSPIVEPMLSHLKGYFSAHPVYLPALFRHIGQFHLDPIKEKYAKEISSILVENSLKIAFFDLYLEYSDSYKHLSTLMQPSLLQNLDVDASVTVLEKLLIKADDDIKVAVLNKFKDNSILRLEHLDVLFEFFKKIKAPLIKKNSLLEFFCVNFIKLKPEYQHQLLIEPMMIEESLGSIGLKSLLEKASTDHKACEMMNWILSKREHAGFAIKNSDLFLHTRVLVDYFLANFHIYDLKYQEIIIKFIEKTFGVYKQEMGFIPVELLQYFMGKSAINPSFYSLIREGIEIDFDKVPISFIFEFLDKVKENTIFSKGEGDKYLKIFKHLSNKVELEVVIEHYLCFAKSPYFQEGHHKEFVNMAIEKAIIEKKQAVLERLLGTKRSLGFGEDKKAQINVSLCKEASKASKKGIELAFLEQIAKATTLLELNVNILNPFKLIIDAYGQEPFIEVKQQLKNRILANLNSNLAKSKTAYQLIISVIQPLKIMGSYFAASKDTNKLCLCILAKFLKQGAEGFEDTRETLEGFVEVLSTVQTLGSIKHLLTGLNLFDLSSEEVNFAVVDILFAKVGLLDKHVNLLSVIEKIFTYEKRLLDPFLNRMVMKYPDLILRFFDNASEYQAVVFLSHLTKAPLSLYNQIAEKLVSRTSSDERFKRSLIEVIRINLDKNLDAFSVILKKLDKVLFFKKILESEFSFFTKIIATYFDIRTEVSDMIDLLEARSLKEDWNMNFYLKLRNDPFQLHIFYIENLSKEKKELFFFELEKIRLEKKESIHDFAILLDIKDREMAKFFFQMMCEKNMALVIDELKVTSFDHYFKCLSNIYYYCVIPGKYQEYYPIIFEDAREKIQEILAKNEAEGELEVSLVNGLIEVIGTLFDAYPHIIKGSDYPFDKHFNPIFLKALIVLLQPNNILKKNGEFFPKLEAILKIIKVVHLKQLINPEYLDLVKEFFNSILRFFAIDITDSVKDISLKKTDYETMAFCLYKDFEKVKLVVHMIMIQWLPILLEQNLDWFFPFITASYLTSPLIISKEVSKIYYMHLYKVCNLYLKSLIESGYKPSLKEEIVDEYLKAFDLKKTTMVQREHAITSCFFGKPKKALTDFTYYACLKKIKESEFFI